MQSVKYIQACSDKVFCQDDVLEKVQMAGIFKDSKTFVDMPLKQNFSKDIRADILRNQTKTELLETVQKYFDEPGKELVAIDIVEPINEPKFLQKIKSKEYKLWATHLCSVWKKLVRKMPGEVQENADRYSLLYMNNSFVVPGGRFREMYYWDTYWSIEGLLLCEMFETTRNILENLLQLVESIGFMPNGGRKYYKNRSQPPFLTLMAERYWLYTKDNNFIKKHMNTLVKEYTFWMKERSVNVTSSKNNKTYNLNLYQSMMGYPRPESYKEDVELMEKSGLQDNTTAQKELYSHIASAAESGWDFSSR